MFGNVKIMLLSHHQDEDRNGHEYDGVPVGDEEVSETLDALLGQQDFAQGGERSRGIDLKRRSRILVEKRGKTHDCGERRGLGVCYAQDRMLMDEFHCRRYVTFMAVHLREGRE